MSAAKFSPAQPPTAAPASVCVRAPGKINVSLRVGPLRPDGYHSVASVYRAVSLFEEVRATVTEGPGITVTVDSDGALQVPVKDIPLGPDNLAVRAAQALAPFAETLQQTGDVKKAAQAAQKGSDSTKGMKASLGRTVYVGGQGWQEVPDPGAYGLSQFFTGLAKSL